MTKAQKIFDKYNLPFNDIDDFVEFIMEHFNSSDFEDSYIPTVVNAEPNEHFKLTVADKIQTIEECLWEIIGEDWNN